MDEIYHSLLATDVDKTRMQRVYGFTIIEENKLFDLQIE
jgi:hypothetical protein